MSDDFKRLYMENNDLRGYLIYQSSAGLFNIEYPVLQSNDNDFYLNRDFYKKTNKQGALFFDYPQQYHPGCQKQEPHHLRPQPEHRADVHLSQQAHHQAEQNYARSAPTMTMNTIYEQATYKVFAVMVVNNDAADGEPLPLSAHRFHRRQRFPPFRRRDPRPVGLRLRQRGRAGGR